jgi:hypothetical protein
MEKLLFISKMKFNNIIYLMFFVILRLNVYQMFKQLINNITYSMINLFKHLIIYNCLFNDLFKIK